MDPSSTMWEDIFPPPLPTILHLRTNPPSRFLSPYAQLRIYPEMIHLAIQWDLGFVPNSDVFGLERCDWNTKCVNYHGHLLLYVGETPSCSILIRENHRASDYSVNVTFPDIPIFINVIVIGRCLRWTMF
jgi:hypothetical protein